MSTALVPDRVCVIGSGAMGAGIVQTLAAADVAVTMVDVQPGALEAARARIEKSLRRAYASRPDTAPDPETVLAKVRSSDDLSVAGEANYVIETITEDLGAKQTVFQALDGICSADTVIASNTSQFSITLLAAATGRGDRVIGTHWFNPPPVMPLVEVVPGVDTSDETIARTRALLEHCGKELVICRKDAQGFITSRLIIILAMEAARIVEEGVGDADEVNRACELAFNHALGPLATIDLSGLDTVLRVADTLTEHYGERFMPPQNLRRLVNAGHLGRKTGRGFSDYTKADAPS